MKVRRLIASVSAGFDDFVNRVENHEAVADCAIEDLRNATAQVRVQQGRTAAQAARLDKQIQELGTEGDRWRARALRVADTDETRALECMRRARHADGKREMLETQRSQHQALADDLANRQRDLEARLSEVQLKRTSLSSRAARAQTIKNAERCGVNESVEAVFDRWETVVTADEYRDGATLESTDILDHELSTEEDLDALRASLEALKSSASDSNTTDGEPRS